jgi:probable HAF family extracellular repeat protein
MGGIKSFAQGINNAGEAVGYVRMSDGSDRAVNWQNGTATDLGIIGRAMAVNNNGQIVGWKTDSSPTSQSIITSLGSLGGKTTDIAAINDNSAIVGSSDTSNGATDGDGNYSAYSHAYLWQNGTMNDLGTLGGNRSRALAINKSGQIVGCADVNNSTVHAFLWQNGAMADLGPSSALKSSATGINNCGVIVGTMLPAAGGPCAVVWQSGAPTDLNTLVPAHSGWTLTQASAVNDAGCIVGLGTYGGVSHGFLLTPNTGG